MTIQRIADQQWRPILFIDSSAMCETSELCDYLSQQPDIFIPREKEPDTSYVLANAKVILLILNQKRRMASVYFMSYLIHKENDFARWIHDYFIQSINACLYYNKIAAHHHELGKRNNLRIIEANNLSSEDEREQLLECLDVKPVRIRHKDATLLGSSDNNTSRELILTLFSVEIRTFR